MRLDQALVARGLARSRGEARELIDSGQIRINGIGQAKPSASVSPEQVLELIGERRPFASRGGIKLAAALDAFAVDVSGIIALDLGASTGGFTDCLLQRGAARVVAIDIGHGQMAPALRDDPRVDLREGVHARDISPLDFESSFDLVVADLSFISLTKIVPALPPVIAEQGRAILLVKPQFEIGRDGGLHKGIVRSEAVRRGAIDGVSMRAAEIGLVEKGRIDSPIYGEKGNREYLLMFSK